MEEQRQKWEVLRTVRIPSAHQRAEAPGSDSKQTSEGTSPALLPLMAVKTMQQASISKAMGP